MSEQDQNQNHDHDQDQDLTLSTLPNLDNGEQEATDDEQHTERRADKGPEPMPLWFKIGLALLPIVSGGLAFGAYKYVIQDNNIEPQTPVALTRPAKEPPRPATAHETEPDRVGEKTKAQGTPGEPVAGGPGGYVIQGLDKPTAGAAGKEPSAGKEPLAEKQPLADKDHSANNELSPGKELSQRRPAQELSKAIPTLLETEAREETQDSPLDLIRDTRTRIERLEGYIMEFIAIADEHRAELTQINKTLSENQTRLERGEQRLAELAQAFEKRQNAKTSTSRSGTPVTFPFQVRSYRQMGGIQSIRLSDSGHCCRLIRVGQRYKDWRLEKLDINAGHARFEHASGQSHVEVF